MPLPTQRELKDALLEEIASSGGEVTTEEAYDRLADRFDLGTDERRATTKVGGRSVNTWKRHVRWARQQAKAEGLLATSEPGVWAVDDSNLGVAREGTLWTVFLTDQGFALWGDVIRATEALEDEIIDLCVTSTPYPLLRPKAYGNLDEASHVDWLTDVFGALASKIGEDGSIALNLGDAYLPGRPTLSLWKERLLTRLVDDVGLHLAGVVYWENPSKLPSPAEWVTVRRERITLSVEPIYWLSRSPHPKANNRRVLKPYSQQMEKRLQEGGETRAQRPSGHAFTDGAFSADNGGAIPHNLLVAANTRSAGPYFDRCREAGLPVHPARFPEEVPEFFIKLTTEAGDLVADPFGGSGTTAAVASRLGRRWVLIDSALQYLRGAAFRMDSDLGFKAHWPRNLPEQTSLL